MVIENQANNDFKLTTEDINVAFQAHPEAAQTAQMNLLKRLIVEKDNLITKQYAELADLQQQLDELTSDK
jgi:hypothetical protein